MATKKTTTAKPRAARPAKESPPSNTEQKPDVSEMAEGQSAAVASAESVTKDPVGEAQAASPHGENVAAQVENMSGEPGEAIQADGQGLDQISSASDSVVTVLHVAARVNGFRRCGRAWPSAGVTVPSSEFSEEQIEILKNEPGLVVTEVAD